MTRTRTFRREGRRRGRVLAAGLLVGALALAGCGTKGGGDGDSGNAPGVTDDTITLGVLTDLSGVFAVLGKTVTQGAQLYFDKVNDEGGVCDRKIKLMVRDHGYDVQKAVGLYADMKSQVLGMEQLLGSPINAALKENVEQDQMFTIPVSWASTILDNPNNMIVGTTYDVEIINGISWLMAEKGIKKGDTIGHIYIEGEYGENGHLGSEYAAKKAGLKLVTAQVTADATDMSSQVAKMKSEGVKAILLTTTPTQTASVGAVNAASGLNVPIVGNNPVFTPELMKTAAGPALAKNLYVMASWQPYASEQAGAKAIATAYEKAHPDVVPNGGVTWGYGAAQAYTEVLKKSCDDLTREGIQKAFRDTTSVDTGGVFPNLDYSKHGEPATREAIVTQADGSVPGGLKVVSDLAASDLATSYPAPAAQ